MRLVLRILLVLLAIALLAWFGGRCYLARSVAQYDGTIRTSVASPVEITFDARGVPQVWAKTDADAYFGIGWLMDRSVCSRWSSCGGSLAASCPRCSARLRMRRTSSSDRSDSRAPRIARELAPATRALMQRYVDGINAAIAQDKLLPPEFVVLRLKPRPWTIEDCLAISHYQTWFSHQLMDQDRRYQQLIEKLGMTASVLTRAGHPWSPPTVPPPVPPMQIAAASNSWAVAASRSSTKAAFTRPIRISPSIRYRDSGISRDCIRKRGWTSLA